MGKSTDITGLRFGRLLVVSCAGRDASGAVIWKCNCECGKESVIRASRLRDGTTKSCGCLRSKHHHWGDKTYQSWANMKARCKNPNNPSYKNYGGRGITLCDRWNSFSNFLEDMGEQPPGLTIERVDNNGIYEKDNCVWATRRVQQNNTRHNIHIQFKGENLTLGQWATKLETDYQKLYDKIRNGCPVEVALSKSG